MAAGDEGGFLARWSRRKREADRPTLEPTPATADEGQDASVGSADDASGTADAFTPEEREAYLARLPSIEEIAADTDLSGFLHPIVPESLRAAALRRMWVVDPMVRDFRSEALDYAWDWNVPGGVPGSGPIGPADAVRRMVADLMGDGEPEPEPGGVSRPVEARLSETVEPKGDAAATTTAGERPSADGAAGHLGHGAPNVNWPVNNPPEQATVVAITETQLDNDPLPTKVEGVRRRHGGALPL